LARGAISRLTSERIDPGEVLRSLTDPGAGAVVLFVGRVRDNGAAGRVEGIEYEAYAPMAEKGLALAEVDARRRWPSTRDVRILHRVGSLEVGDVSVAVAVSSPHRAEAFEACRHIMERIKRDVPIWKQERTVDGKRVWVEGHTLGAAAGPTKIRI
jgi:molybdopterin synthase catalytic subunit